MILKKIFEFGFIGIFLTLDAIIYDLIAKAFNIFMAIAGARLLSSKAYTDVAEKMYIIVGVLMLFVLSYSILRAIVDPDKNLKEELGAKMVQRVIIAVVGLAMSPVLFNLLYRAQGLILDNNILGNLFFNEEELDDGTNPNDYISSIGGSVTATSLWEAFFYPSEESGKGSDEIEADPSEYFVATVGWGAACAAGAVASAALWEIPVVNIFVIGATVFSCIKAYNNSTAYSEASSQTNGEKVTLREAYARTAAGDSFKIYIAFMNNYMEDGEITYLYIISTICGGFALYAFISFSIDMGVRAAKMAYLQIVSPIPLIMQVIPSNKDVFDKYLKSVKNTFLEVFIRVSVVYVVIYIICHLTKLFSSSTNLWGNQELSGPSKYFALALLILGLIAFCRKAPDIISETLNIPKGDMKLGLREKLAQGGAFAAGGIVGAGFTSGFRGFTRKDVAGRNAAERGLRRLGYGVSGILGGAGRATWNQFGPGEDKHEAKDFKGMRDVASRASRAQDDATGARDARNKNRDQATEELQNKRDEYNQAVERYRTATTTAAREAARQDMERLDKEIQGLEQTIYDNTTAGNWLNERGKRIRIWASGTVDLTLEDNAIKFGGSLGDLQDKLRQEAYVKKDALSKQLKHEYDVLEAEKVSEYQEGWDEQSYNDALRSRLSDTTTTEGAAYQTKLAAHQAADAAYSTAQAELTAARASGDATRISAAQAAFTSASATLDTTRTELAAARKVVSDRLDVEAKLTDAEISAKNQDLQNRRDAAKKAYEAASDAWIQQKLAEGDAEITSIVNNFLRDNAAFIQNNPNMKIPIAVDANGNVTKSITVSDLVNGNFGGGGIAGSIQADDFKGSTKFVFDPKDGTDPVEYTFDTNTKQYKGPDGRTYQPGEFFTHITAMLRSHPGADFEGQTAVTNAKNQGKKVKVNMPNTKEYADKANIRREADKNGK